MFTEGLEKHALKLGYACHVRRHTKGFKWRQTWLKFTTREEFWNFVESKVELKCRLWLIAHQQHFDFMVVNGFAELVNRGFELTRHIINSNLFIATFKRDSSTITVVDSLNWLRASIKGLGEAIGKPKLEIEFETCSLKELAAYCKQDVLILKDSVLELIRFIRSYNLGNYQYTRSSQAMTAYKHRFMKHKIFIHAHRQATSLEREAYRGGCNEAYFLGLIKGSIYDLDVNSLYPFVMQTEEYPTKFIRYMESTTVEDLERLLTKYGVIAKVLIRINKPIIGIKTERLIFPIGQFWATLTTPELKAVLEYGEILVVKELAMYEMAPIFRKWVDELYALRLQFKAEGNKVFEEFAKGLLNGLYGKFGQKVRDFKLIGEAPIEEIQVERIVVYETREVYTETTFGGKIFKQAKGNKEWRDSFVAIAAHVTAYARLYLQKLIELADRKHVHYCDTDSLFVDAKGYKRLKKLLHETKLGYLKLEGQGNTLELRGCKDYTLGDTTRIKGIKKDAKQLSENQYEQTRFYKFRSLLRKGILDAPLTERIVKTLKREYLKGVINKNGRVSPFVLSQQPS